MAYYLAVKNKDSYKTLDVSSLKEFSRISKYSGPAYHLREIDTLTTHFNDEVSFKKILISKGILTIDDILKDITIRIKRNQKLEKVRYGLFYSGQSKYLDELYLREILLSKQNDYDFLERLVSYYRNSYINNINISILSVIVKNKEGYKVKEILDDFYFREVYRLNRSTGELELNYKAFHDLAMFIYTYIKIEKNKHLGITEIMEKEERKQKLIELRESILNIPNNQTNKKKTRTLKKNEQIEGQISLFDNNY